MSGLSLQLGGVACPLPATGAYRLDLDEQAAEETLDALLEQLRLQGADVAWLPAQGALVSNLSLLENCLLPLRWHWRLTPAEIEVRCSMALGCLGGTLEQAGWLRQRPAQASRQQLQQALYLRALLLQPAVLLISPGGLRGRLGDTAMEALWPRWLSGSLLLYTGSDSAWPVLPALCH